MNLLMIYHYFICCKLTFDIQRNSKLHVLNIHYYKLVFQNFLQIFLEIKF